LETKAAADALPVDSNIQPYMGRGAGGSLPVCPLDSQNTFDTSYNPQIISIPPTCLISSSNHVLN
jgi:hypothetical protein